MNKYFKLVIAFLIIVSAVLLIVNREIPWGIILIILSIFPILLYFRNEYILLSFWQIRKQNLQKAKFWLDKIKNPEKELVRKQFGYYNYLHGICISQDNLVKAESYMKKALNFGLTFDHDKAMAYLNLASVALNKGKKMECEKYLVLVKKYDKSNMLTDQIKMIKENMKKVNIGKNIQNPNIRNRGKYF